MRTHHIFSSGAAALLLAFVAAGAAAQPAPADQAEQRARVEAERRAEEAERRREQAEREAEKRESEQDAAAEHREAREGLQSELQDAREELQEAAQEVARLSAELAAPFVNGVTRGFRFAGQRAMLGLGIEDTERGVRVASVSPNGPGADAGLKVGDVIIAIDGAGLADTRVAGGGKQSPSELLFAQMANVDPGESVKLRVLSESGAERDATVKAREISPRVFTQMPDKQNYSYAFRGPGPTGNWFFNKANPWSQMQVITLTPALGKYFGTDKGLLVVRGPENAEIGLRDGDVILDIGGREPTTPEHAIRILGSFAAGEPLKITIMREQRRQVVDAKIPADGAG